MRFRSEWAESGSSAANIALLIIIHARMMLPKYEWLHIKWQNLRNLKNESAFQFQFNYLNVHLPPFDPHLILPLTDHHNLHFPSLILKLNFKCHPPTSSTYLWSKTDLIQGLESDGRMQRRKGNVDILVSFREDEERAGVWDGLGLLWNVELGHAARAGACCRHRFGFRLFVFFLFLLLLFVIVLIVVYNHMVKWLVLKSPIEFLRKNGEQDFKSGKCSFKNMSSGPLLISYLRFLIVKI